MPDAIKPENQDQLIEAIREAADAETPLEVRGTGSKAGLGNLGGSGAVLDLSAFTGITLYEPEELVMTAGAATPMAEIEAALSEKGQRLDFEPMDLGSIYGTTAGGGTIGGVIACNLTGPRRIKAGAARDHILGFKAVSGQGEAFKSGGRVVKNVTGFDLSKLICGSFGTLAAMTEVTFKVMPRPEKRRTVLILGMDAENARRTLGQVLGGPFEVSAAAHLPMDVAMTSSVEMVSGAGRSVTAVRLEGPGPSVEYSCRAIRESMDRAGGTEELHTANSVAFWREVRDAAFFDGDAESQIWRISVPPSAGAGVSAAILGRIGGKAYFDWGGGLIWMALAPRDDGGAAIVRAAIPEGDGHATLIRAADAVRGDVPVFQPQTPALAALSHRVKESFDPQNILNPGRMRT